MIYDKTQQQLLCLKKLAKMDLLLNQCFFHPLLPVGMLHSLSNGKWPRMVNVRRKITGIKQKSLFYKVNIC